MSKETAAKPKGLNSSLILPTGLEGENPLPKVALSPPQVHPSTCVHVHPHIHVFVITIVKTQ